MAMEIELKVRVKDVDTLGKRLIEICGPPESSYLKKDVYYSKEPFAQPPLTSFRLRDVQGKQIVTRKEKRILDGIEQSREIEFAVEDPGAFHDFALSLGYSIIIKKVKEGHAYRQGPWLLELSNVHGLGWFLEIERLLPDNASQSEISSTRSELLRWLQRLGIPSGELEKRPYTQLLSELKGKQQS